MKALRQIPPVNDVLRSVELEPFRDILKQPFVAFIVDEVFSEVRRDLEKSTESPSRKEITARIAAQIASNISRCLRLSLRRVINASGVILHTNLGRAPLPQGAIEHVREVCTGYSNLEFDIDRGERGKRDSHVDQTLRQLLGCEASVIVNNNAAAVLLVLNTLGQGGEVVASRGEQVEIGESFRIPEIMARSGALLREVGSTNRTRIKDYERAITDHTRLLLRVHPSNFRMVGFTQRPTLSEFIELGRRRNIATFEDLGSGCLTVRELKVVEGEPCAADSIRAGVDIISFSGDKLLGGPQAGIIAGKKLYIEKIRQNPLFRALRVDKLTIAVLEYVLQAYLRGGRDGIPAWKMLNATEQELRLRAEAFSRRAGARAEPIALKSLVGGGSAPETQLLSWGVRLNFPHLSDTELERRLRSADPPVIVRIDQGKVVLDLRTVFPEEEETLLRILEM